MPARSKSSKQPRTAESILAERAATAAASAGPATTVKSAGKQPKPVVEEVEEVEDVDVEEVDGSETESESDGSSLGSDSDDLAGFLDGVELDNVMSNYFMYQHDDGSVLNITDAILLTKESIDRQTECIEKLCQLLATKLK